MKILFSDYDGTIKTFRNNPNIFEKITFNKNIKSINNFINKGNKFIITTGRSTNSILKEIEQYNIDFSYLTTYDGRVTFDSNLNLIQSKTINKEVLLELKKIIENEKYVINKTIYNEYGRIKELNNVVLIAVSPVNIRTLQRILIETFKNEKNIEIIDNYEHNEIVVAIRANKANAARSLSVKNNWDEDDIYCVGDSKNDLDLLNEFRGFRMSISHNSLLMPIENVTSSVHKLIKKINK